MPTVLVVDDSAVDRRLAAGLLEKNPALTIEFADGGRAAIARLNKSLPDIIVCDMQMPDLDGLELVETVRERWPLVPVVLMTAYGSEEIAVQALKRGAASYVPKSTLAKELLDTVDNVLAVARADRRNERLRSCLVRSESFFSLENDPALISATVDHLQEYVARMRMSDETGRIRVGIALEEALLNALYHGNLELTTQQLADLSENLANAGGPALVTERSSTAPYCNRKIHVEVVVTPDQIEYVIRDDGPGFKPDLPQEPGDVLRPASEGGRGLTLIRAFMDEVTFNDRGNEIRLIKRREPHVAAAL
jgi:CheY-like chemotaxis protein